VVNRRQDSTTIQWSTEFKFISVSQLMISFVNSYMTRRVQTQPNIFLTVQRGMIANQVDIREKTFH